MHIHKEAGCLALPYAQLKTTRKSHIPSCGDALFLRHKQSLFFIPENQHDANIFAVWPCAFVS